MKSCLTVFRWLVQSWSYRRRLPLSGTILRKRLLTQASYFPLYVQFNINLFGKINACLTITIIKDLSVTLPNSVNINLIIIDSYLPFHRCRLWLSYLDPFQYWKEIPCFSIIEFWTNPFYSINKEQQRLLQNFKHKGI